MMTTLADMQVELVSLSSLVLPRNIREQLVEEDQVALAQSIKETGIRVPLLGHREGNAIVLDDGFRRVDGAKRNKLEVVPMIVSAHAPTPAELLTLQLVVNGQRSGLKTMERVRAIDRLINESGWSAAEVSLKLGGPSAATISKLLALLVLPKEVQDLIDAGRMPMSSAYAIATVADVEKRERLVGEVLNGRLTRDRLVANIKSAKKQSNRAPRRKKSAAKRPRVVVPLGDGCSVAVNSTGVTLQSFIERMQSLLERVRGLEPQEMTWEQAAKVLAAGNIG